MKKLSQFLIISVLFLPVWAQYYFGQNKIQPREYDWHVMSTPHFEIFYYIDEYELAEHTATLCEKYFANYTNLFSFMPNEKILIVLYSTPELFSETHIVPYILPEGVGGLTEFIKGRVLVPFEGLPSRFEHVLAHELIHVWQLHYDEYLHDAHELFFMQFPPLWFVEGQAELRSQPLASVDERTELIACLANDRFVLPNEFFRIEGTYQMYQEGAVFLRFLTDNYCHDADITLFEKVWQHSFFDDVFRSTIGVDLSAAGLLWRRKLQLDYGDYISLRMPANTVGKILSPSGYFFTPIKSDSVIFCKANFLGYSGIYKLINSKPFLVQRIELSKHAESSRLFGNTIDSHDTLLAYTVKMQGVEELCIMSLLSGGLRRFRWSNIVELTSPRFSPSGDKIAFSGAGIDGFVHGYIFDIQKDTLIRISREDEFIADIAFLSDDTVIYSGEKPDSSPITVLAALSSKSFWQISFGPNIHRPRNFRLASNNARNLKLLFIADDDTFPDVYAINMQMDTIFKLTNISEPVYDVTHVNNDTILISRRNANGTAIVELEMRHIFVGTVQKMSIANELPITKSAPMMSSDTAFSGKPSNPHKLTFDLAQGAIGLTTSQESDGGLQIALSDMVGERQLYCYFVQNAQKLSNFFSDANIIVAYTLQQNRWGWSFGGYHIHNYNYNRIDGSFDERQAGTLGAVRYSLSRYQRLEATGYAYYSDRNSFSIDRADGIFAINLSFIHDNALWGWTGPIDGARANLTAGFGSGMTGELYFYLLSADLRYYLRTSKRSALALRAIARTSDGAEPNRFYMGGTWDMRTYPYYYFYGRQQVLANAEWRFPLIDVMAFKTPLGFLQLGGVRGAFFVDAGDCFEEQPQLVGSVGFGLRANLGGVVVLRSDFARHTDFRTIEPEWNWDVFFGWDF